MFIKKHMKKGASCFTQFAPLNLKELSIRTSLLDHILGLNFRVMISFILRCFFAVLQALLWTPLDAG